MTDTSDNKKLLEDIYQFFATMGVREGVGIDGKLMERMKAALSGVEIIRIEIPRGSCPVCKAPDMATCDCDPMEQLATSQK